MALLYISTPNVTLSFVLAPFPHLDTVSSTALISGYVQAGLPHEALHVFDKMHTSAAISDQHGFESSIYVASSLINMYGKCQMLDDARQVFDAISRKNMIVWNAMLGVYSHNGFLSNVMELFLDMTTCGVHLDEFAYTSILSTCACFECLDIGYQLHSAIMKKRFTSNLFANNALIDMYAKAGALKEAIKQFEHTTYRDHIS
ncbi:hypothetical protein JHK87_022176 [Glycine soja]|nr:hypothetical protein JHK87_022176 [Glycine soja]